MNSSVIKVSNAGSATGAYQRADRAIRAFLYTGTTPPTDIGTLGGTNSFGTGINNNNIVVGSSTGTDGRSLAFRYNGSLIALDTPAGLRSRADAINNAASPLIVGALIDSGGILTPTTWKNGARVDLDKLNFARGHALSVNDVEQIVGALHNTIGNYSAVMWVNGAATLLGFLPGGGNSFAREINNFGQVVGYSSAAASSQQAFLWTPTSGNATTGSIIALGGLGGSTSAAYDVNARGVVVGTATTGSGESRAFVWTPTSTHGTTGAIHDLNSRLTTDSQGWVVEVATSINDGDVIVGWGRSPSGQTQRAILLDPA
jgi:probable HAF family extracellular repeat protein